MRGRGALWQMGTDHAGISTQMLVERQLNAAGKTRAELGREKFIERVWRWKQESGGNISAQLRRMGSSLDWSRERFTLDEGYARAVVEAFVRLHEDGLIYRGQRLVNWDPALGTAISDLEVINKEEEGSLWHMRYPLCDGLKNPGWPGIIWWWPPPARKPCWGTRRWRCIPTTNATAPWSANGRGCPWWAGSCPSSRTAMLIRPSAPAASRSPRLTTSTTTPWPPATTCPRSTC